MQILIRRTWKVDSELTDVTSCELSSPDGLYGVKRVDTGAVVVADGTAMTRVSVGTYEHTFTGLAGVAYTGYVEFVWQGAAYHFEHDIPATLETSAELTYPALCVAIADFLGWTRNTEGAGSNWTSDTLYRLSDIIHSGYLQFIYPPILPGEATAHRWTFLRPAGTLETVADTYLYDLPAAFGAIVGDMVYDSESSVSRTLDHVSPGFIDRQRTIISSSGRPSYFALRPKAVDETAQQVTECMLHPTPDSVYDLVYYYDAKINRLSATNLYPLGGQQHAETLLQSCRDIAAQRYMDNPGGREHDLFLQRLQASVEFDRRLSPQFLGYNTDSERNHSFTRRGSNFRVSLKHNLGGG